MPKLNGHQKAIIILGLIGIAVVAFLELAGMGGDVRWPAMFLTWFLISISAGGLVYVFQYRVVRTTFLAKLNGYQKAIVILGLITVVIVGVVELGEGGYFDGYDRDLCWSEMFLAWFVVAIVTGVFVYMFQYRLLRRICFVLLVCSVIAGVSLGALGIYTYKVEQQRQQEMKQDYYEQLEALGQIIAPKNIRNRRDWLADIIGGRGGTVEGKLRIVKGVISEAKERAISSMPEETRVYWLKKAIRAKSIQYGGRFSNLLYEGNANPGGVDFDQFLPENNPIRKRGRFDDLLDEARRE